MRKLNQTDHENKTKPPRPTHTPCGCAGVVGKGWDHRTDAEAWVWALKDNDEQGYHDHQSIEHFAFFGDCRAHLDFKRCGRA